jgi:hypothetical protein
MKKTYDQKAHHSNYFGNLNNISTKENSLKTGLNTSKIIKLSPFYDNPCLQKITSPR